MEMLSFYLQDYSLGRCYNLYSRAEKMKNEPANTLATSWSSPLVKSMQPWYCCAILVLWPLIVAQARFDPNFHQPYRWALRDPVNNRVIQEVTTAGTPRFSVLIRDIFPSVVTHDIHPRSEL